MRIRYILPLLGMLVVLGQRPPHALMMSDTLQRDIAATLHAAQTTEPPVYPPGYYCSPAGTVSEGRVIDPDHPCACHKTCATGTDEEGTQTPYVAEDSKCLQWCNKSHCGCPVPCCDEK